MILFEKTNSIVTKEVVEVHTGDYFFKVKDHHQISDAIYKIIVLEKGSYNMIKVRSDEFQRQIHYFIDEGDPDWNFEMLFSNNRHVAAITEDEFVLAYNQVYYSLPKMI